MNYGNHNRNLGGRHGGFTADEWENFRDNQSSWGSDWVAPGKTVRPEHYKMPLPEVTVDGVIETLLEALKKGLGNKVENWYKLGCAYRKKGDNENARLFFQKAVGFGHPDAMEELAALNGLRRETASAGVVMPQSYHSCTANATGVRIKYFKVHEIVLRNGSHEYLLLVDVGDRRGLQPASQAFKGILEKRDSDVYSTQNAAHQAGIALKHGSLHIS